MSVLGAVVLLEASTADVFEGLSLFVLIIVGTFLWTVLVVKVDTNLIVSHEGFRNTVNILLTLLLLAGLVAGRGTGIRLELPSAGESVRLRNLRESGPNIFESGLDEWPIVPLKLAHHPTHHHLVTSFQDLLVRIMK